MNLFPSKNLKSLDVPIEVDFIRACARLEMTPLWQERIQTYLDKDLDWKQVLPLANHHRVLPLVYRMLYTNFKDQVPEDALVELRTAYQSNAARNLFLTNELVNILDLFEAKGISGMAIKGPVLAKAIYGDVTLRQFDDLDILVREGDVASASELLLSLGYTPVVAAVGSEAETFLRSEGECGFVSPSGRSQVDIHWQMVPRSFLVIDHDGLWDRCGRISLEGQPFPSFSSEDLLLLLSIHGMRHLWSRHAWICDLAFTIQKEPDLDWERVFDRAGNIKAERFLSIGLLLISEYYGLDLPEWVWKRVESDRRAKTLAERIQNAPGFCQPIKISLMHLYWVNALVRKGMVGKLSYLFKQLLTPSLEDLSTGKVHPSFSFFYSVMRPLRITFQYLVKWDVGPFKESEASRNHNSSSIVGQVQES